jgi:hypothetical protein
MDTLMACSPYKSRNIPMKLRLLSVVASVALVALNTPTAFAAVDYDYFFKQSCDELGKELDSLKKAEKVVNDGVKKKDSDANVKAAVGFLLTGWPFWGSADHGNANNQLQEIRDDIKFITRAQKSKKCAA